MLTPAGYIALALLVSGVSSLMASFLLFKRRPWRSYPACGACGYPVRGLTTTICPECGADRNIVGQAMIRPRAKPVEGILLALGALLTTSGAAWLVYEMVLF